MIDRKEFDAIRKSLSDSDQDREKVIRDSRDMIKLSKLIIYSIHRNELNEADRLIKRIKADYKGLNGHSLNEYIYHTAVQEYAEAICFFEFVKHKKLPTRKELNVGTESYLMGLCDLTGELMRKAVDCAINSDFESLKAIRELVTGIYGEFLKFNLGNGELRKKYDSIKWNLNKIEDVLYDVKIRKSK